jgi:hypothetical protein
MKMNTFKLFRDLETLFRHHRRSNGIDRDTAFADILADLRHVADKHKVDWSDVVSRADKYYFDETRDGSK